MVDLLIGSAQNSASYASFEMATDTEGVEKSGGWPGLKTSDFFRNFLISQPPIFERVV
jgi:hypothetical protein